MEAVKIPSPDQPWSEDEPLMARLKQLGAMLPEDRSPISLPHPPVKVYGEGLPPSQQLIEDRR